MNNLNLDEYVIKDDFYKSIQDEIICPICSIKLKIKIKYYYI